MERYHDPRIPLIKKVLGIILPKTFIGTNPSIMVTKDNKLIAIVLDTTIYSVNLNYKGEMLPTIGFQYNSLIIEDESDDSYIIDYYILRLVGNIFFKYDKVTIDNKNLLACRDNLKDDSEFQKYLSLKSADGMKFYKIPGNDIYNPKFYHIPVFSGFPLLNKSDNIAIRVFNLYDGHLLVIFDIFKKKLNSNYQMYFRTLLLN